MIMDFAINNEDMQDSMKWQVTETGKWEIFVFQTIQFKKPINYPVYRNQNTDQKLQILHALKLMFTLKHTAPSCHKHSQ